MQQKGEANATADVRIPAVTRGNTYGLRTVAKLSPGTRIGPTAKTPLMREQDTAPRHPPGASAPKLGLEDDLRMNPAAGSSIIAKRERRAQNGTSYGADG